MNHIEAMKQALEALQFARLSIDEWSGYASDYFQNKYDLKGDIAEVEDAIATLRTAIDAAEKQEPVAWMDSADNIYYDQEDAEKGFLPIRPLYTTPPAAPVQEPMNWREHVEQRIRTWRQRTMNKCGDMLAIDDFMGQDSIDDLVDFVCDEWAGPPAAQPAVPLTDEQINLFINGRGDEDDEDYVEPTGDGFGLTDEDLVKLVRRVEAAHGITGETK